MKASIVPRILALVIVSAAYLAVMGATCGECVTDEDCRGAARCVQEGDVMKCQRR